MRPRRRVEWVPGSGWAVTHSDFATTDQYLACQVRDELDRTDPLPCPHDGEWINIRTFGSPWATLMCRDCGHRKEEGE